MYSWGSARGSARPTACPPCLGRFSRGDRGTLRPRPPLEGAASSEAAGREAERQQGKSQRRLASKAAESRARRAFIARGGGGEEEEEGGPTCGSGGPRSGAGTARRRGAERGLHPDGLGPEQPAPPRGYRPAADRPVGAPSPPSRGGPAVRFLGVLLCTFLAVDCTQSVDTRARERSCTSSRDASLRAPLLINRPMLWCGQVSLGCCSFGLGQTRVMVMILLEALCMSTAMCPRASCRRGVFQGEFGGKWGSLLRMQQSSPRRQPQSRPCYLSEREEEAL